MSPFIAELLGTMVMILLGDGVVANVVLKKTKGFQAGWITITTAWALAVFTGVVIAGPYSGAHLNPAITIGFAIAEKFPWASVGPYIIAQMLGAALGAFLVWIIYYDHFKATEDTGAKLGVFCTAPEIRHNIVNFGCELIATFVLMFSVFYITGAELKLCICSTCYHCVPDPQQDSLRRHEGSHRCDRRSCCRCHHRKHYRVLHICRL